MVLNYILVGCPCILSSQQTETLRKHADSTVNSFNSTISPDRPIEGNPRQSGILNSTLGFRVPGIGFRIFLLVSGAWIPESLSGILGIADSTSKNMPDSGFHRQVFRIWITSTWAGSGSFFSDVW